MPYKNVPKKKLSLWFKFSGDANVSVGKPKFFIKLTGSIELEHHRSYELPSNTILGYACYEVKFDPDMGTFELVLALAIVGSATLLGAVPAWRAYRNSLSDGLTVRL